MVVIIPPKLGGSSRSPCYSAQQLRQLGEIPSSPKLGGVTYHCRACKNLSRHWNGWRGSRDVHDTGLLPNSRPSDTRRRRRRPLGALPAALRLQTGRVVYERPSAPTAAIIVADVGVLEKRTRDLSPSALAAPAAWRSSPPCGGLRRGSAGWLPSGAAVVEIAERCPVASLTMKHALLCSSTIQGGGSGMATGACAGPT